MAKPEIIEISEAAVSKVKDPAPIPTVCRYCESEVRLVNNSEIYGRSYGKWPYAYKCEDCDSYVGVHPHTNIPLGSLANRELRKHRKDAKDYFHSFCRNLSIPRGRAYGYLAKAMDIPASECHFGMFDKDRCLSAIVALEALYPVVKQDLEDS